MKIITGKPLKYTTFDNKAPLRLVKTVMQFSAYNYTIGIVARGLRLGKYRPSCSVANITDFLNVTNLALITVSIEGMTKVLPRLICAYVTCTKSGSLATRAKVGVTRSITLSTKCYLSAVHTSRSIIFDGS